MMDPIGPFCEVPCLTEHSQTFRGRELLEKWLKGSDKRYLNKYLQKLIDYNTESFRFLGITPIIEGVENNISIHFRTSSYVGAIPLVAPHTGKQMGDFVVTPRYQSTNKDDYTQILNLLHENLSPEIQDSLPLASGSQYCPPLYMEAIKFIHNLSGLLKTEWTKFKNIEILSNNPSGSINWDKYIRNEYKVEKRLLFPIRKNKQSKVHNELCQMKYVYELCKKELISPRTPIHIYASQQSTLKFIEQKLYFHPTMSVKEFSIKLGDSIIISQCKQQANKILFNTPEIQTAWRLDFTDVFEKFTQYVFQQVSLEYGGILIPNFRLQTSQRTNYLWEIKHLEPDAVYTKGCFIAYIDAKYKSNLYNPYSTSDILKDEFRKDVHQILAYSGFNTAQNKMAFLCYPSSKVSARSITYTNRLNDTCSKINILGIPLTLKDIEPSKQQILNILKQHLNN